MLFLIISGPIWSLPFWFFAYAPWEFLWLVAETWSCQSILGLTTHYPFINLWGCLENVDKETKKLPRIVHIHWKQKKFLSTRYEKILLNSIDWLKHKPQNLTAQRNIIFKSDKSEVVSIRRKFIIRQEMKRWLTNQFVVSILLCQENLINMFLVSSSTSIATFQMGYITENQTSQVISLYHFLTEKKQGLNCATNNLSNTPINWASYSNPNGKGSTCRDMKQIT